MPGIKDLQNILKKGEGKNTLLTAQFAQELISELLPLFNIQVFDSNGVKHDVKYSGLNVVITLKPISGGEPVEGGTFRGLWAGGSAKYQERWKVASGAYAGVYVCVNPNGTNLNPWQGVDWIQETSQIGQIGNWT